jgi:hypothetical protein
MSVHEDGSALARIIETECPEQNLGRTESNEAVEPVDNAKNS